MGSRTNLSVFVVLLAAGACQDLAAAPSRQPRPARAPSTAVGSRLLAAIIANEAPAVRRLLAQGADPNARDSAGSPALSLAVRTLGHDTRIVQALLDAGADVNAPDSRGVRPLGVAPLFGEVATVRILLDRGAAVNSVDPFGRTALMVAAGKGSEQIVTLLLRRGAEVNRVAKAGDTALLRAVRAGKPEVVRALLDHGAVLAADKQRDTTLVVAAETGNAAIAGMLLKHGADVSAADEYGDTPLIQAAGGGAHGVAQILLEHGAPVNARNASGQTPLLAASRNGSVEVMRALLARGADANARDNHGASPLLMAAVRGHLPAVRLLLERGADPQIRDGRGRTALARATALGNTAVAEELAARGAAASPGADEVEIRRTAVESGLGLLQRSGAVFREKSKNVCFSCHHQSLPVMAFTAARAGGFAVDGRDLQEQLQHVADTIRRNKENYRSGVGVPGQVSVAGYGLWTLHAGGRKPDDSTRAVVDYLLQRDRKLGYWRTAANRPPSSGSAFATTYVALRSLRAYATPAHAGRVAARAAAVRRWLTRTPARDTEDRVFRLWALQVAGAPRVQVERAAKQLLALQGDDGGWAQLPGMTSDAYATGSALVALHQTGTLTTTDPSYQRGIRYLLRTQEEDGSWFVRTRAAPLQPFFESGFPHGRSQYISASATGWALWALLL